MRKLKVSLRAMTLVGGVILASLTGCRSAVDDAPRILVFSSTNGYRHAAIESGIAAIQKLGLENDFDVVATEDSSKFNDDSLRTFDAVVFLLTTGDVLGTEEETAFKRFIQAGGGYVGVHSASDTEYEWPWYGNLVGGYFTGHPSNPGVREASMSVVNREHLSTQHLSSEWIRFDEWYDIRFVNQNITPLLLIDETTYKTEDENPATDARPIAWYQDYDGGRSFYTALGHTAESYSDPQFLSHLLGAIRYAAGSEGLDNL